MLGRLLLFASLLLPLPAMGQIPTGDWNGALKTPAGEMRLLFQFRETAAGLEVIPTQVDLRKATLPAARVPMNGKDLSFSFPALNSSYQGALSDDGKAITGNWTQGGKSQPLNLVPGTITPAILHKPEAGDLTIEAPGGTLGGTILKAGDGKLAAVIISGAGPANRDGDSMVNGGRGTYRDIAQGLAGHDITTLRIDKRGVAQSAAAMRHESELRIQIYADDVRAWAAELKKRSSTRCVWLIGHSEGAATAKLATVGNKDICGIVSLAGLGQRADIAWRDGLARITPPDQQQRVNELIDALVQGRQVADPPPVVMGAFRPSIQPFMISIFAQDPSALLGKLKVPVLILQGDADTSVPPENAKALAAARPDATLKILPGVNHSLRPAADDKGTGPGPLAPGITEAIADFMKAH